MFLVAQMPGMTRALPQAVARILLVLGGEQCCLEVGFLGLQREPAGCPRDWGQPGNAALGMVALYGGLRLRITIALLPALLSLV